MIGQGNEGQVEAAVEETGHHFLGRHDRDVDGHLGKRLAQLAQGAAQAVNQGGGAGGEMERPLIGQRVALKFTLDLGHLAHHRARPLGQAQGRGGRNQALSRAHKQVGVELAGQVLELQADRAGRQVYLFGRARDAGAFHHRQKQLELPELHFVSVT